MAISAHLRRLVISRANACCEYCQIPQAIDEATFEIDHIRPEKHAGQTHADNLALACFPCNNHKGPILAGIDPTTDEVHTLFNPRLQVWSEHFEWRGARLIGKTPIGRATIEVLEINETVRVALRESLIEEGIFPPPT